MQSSILKCKLGRLNFTVTLTILCASFIAAPAHAVETTQGKLADGTPYRIDFPDKWNGTVLIGLDYAGRDPMAEGDASIGNRKLMELGYAMAGTTRTVTGWAIHQAAANAIQTLDLFEAKYGKPKYAVEFGGSQGGHTAAVSVQAYPQRWSGAVAQCGGLSGAIGQWQGKFDALFVAKTLLVSNPAQDSSLPIIGIPKDFQTTVLPAWRQTLEAAEQTPQGRARIALAAMIGQLPEWPDRTKPIPKADDLEARQSGLNDSLVSGRNLLNQAMSSRSQIESLSGGNITSNVGVDYTRLLQEVDTDGLIARLYRQAGLDLGADLERLARAPRIAADPKAVAYMASGVFDGDLKVPVLTESGIGDPISVVVAQQAYEAEVKKAGKEDLLRQVYTASAGHCGFTQAESVAAVQTLMQRLETGKWSGTSAADMNRKAEQTGLVSTANASRFVDYTPARFVRPYSACDLERDLKAANVKPMAAPGQALPVCR